MSPRKTEKVKKGSGNTMGMGHKRDPKEIGQDGNYKRKNYFPPDCTKVVLKRTTHITIIK